jgi:small subunit ribosomal protein S17
MSEMEAAIQPDTEAKRGRRHELVGLVTSDKMEKTVVITVERLVPHHRYGRVVKRRSKFMAHNELGAGVGDKVRLVECRPLSARKRWRVIEIIQRAAKRVVEEGPEGKTPEQA